MFEQRYNIIANSVYKHQYAGCIEQEIKVGIIITLPMIESGDVGKAVEVWQKIVGTAEDGEFGPKTKAATIAFQQRYSLEVDGIASPQSWGAGLKTLL